jgi:hypothetical protein
VGSLLSKETLDRFRLFPPVRGQLLIIKGEQSSLPVLNRDGRRFVAHAEEKLTAFMELESAVSEMSRSSPCRIMSVRSHLIFPS